MISDLMFFSALLILVMYLPDKIMNFDTLVELIEISTCFLKGFFIITQKYRQTCRVRVRK